MANKRRIWARPLSNYDLNCRTRFDVPFEVRKRPDREQIPTGIPAIDKLTEGGIPRGTLTEICGTESTGRTALVFALLGQATQRGECCAWIDTARVRSIRSRLSKPAWISIASSG